MADERQLIRTPGLGIKLLAGLMLISAACFLALLADLPHIPMMVLFGWLLALCLRRPLRVTDRTVTYSILFAIMVATVLGYFYPFERGRLGFFSYFFRPEYYCAFALNIALVSCFFPSRSLIAATCISAVVFVLGTCGDVSDLNYINVRFLWGSHWINNHYLQAYASMVGFELVLALLMLKVSRPPGQAEARQRLQARAITLLSVLLLGGMIALVFYLHDVYGKQIRNLEQSFIAAGGHSMLRHLSRRTEPFFGEDVDLNRPLPFGDPEKERRILLRVIASSAPGYLRSRVFCHYDQGRWTLPENFQALALLSEAPRGILALTRYRREDRKAHPENRFDIYFSASLHLDKLPMPSPYACVDLIADNLSADIEGQLSPTKWKRDGGYVAYTSEGWQPGQAFDLPGSEQALSTRYLQVPEELSPELACIIEQLPELREAAPDAEFCAGLVQYLQRNFTYRLGSFRDDRQYFRHNRRVSAGSLRRRLYAQRRLEDLSYRQALRDSPEEPVLHFLQESRAGHCELFASAAVLLLRQNGIPARYVTGFLCFERHPGGGYFVSRLGHAHAWVEAFDRQRKQWLLLDPTPPDGIRNFENSWTAAETVKDRLRHLLDQLLASVQRGLFASAVLSFLKLLWFLFWNPAGVLLTLLTTAWYLHFRRKRRKAELIALTERQKMLAKSFEKLLRQWEKRMGIGKSGSRTGRELLEAARQNETVTPDQLAELKAQIASYEKERFGE